MSKKEVKSEVSESRRKFIKTAAYATPVVITMAVAPSVHAYGSSNTSPNPPTNKPAPPRRPRPNNRPL